MGSDSEDVEGGSREDGDDGEGADDENDTDGDDGGEDGEAALEIVDHELVVDEGEFSTDVSVAATVENSGDARSGTLELKADWYDGGGDYLDNSSAYLQSLGAGETWDARIYFLGTGAEDVDDYEVEGEYDTEPPNFDVEGLELLEDELEVGDREAVIRGRVENTTGEEQSYVKAIGKVYDGDGVVLGDDWTNVTDLRDGDTWSFDMSWSGRDRIDEAEDHEVLVTDSSF